MLIIAGTLTMPPENVARHTELVGPFAELVRAEPGCRDYVFTPNPHEPGEVRLFEIWDDEASLHAHFATPHMAQWREDTATLGITGRDLVRYEVESSAPL